MQTHDLELPDCAGGESFALMVMGHSMAPEFLEGEIIIIEPEGLAKDGAYVLAWHNEEWTFRQLVRTDTGWVLHPLSPAFADAPWLTCRPCAASSSRRRYPGGAGHPNTIYNHALLHLPGEALRAARKTGCF
ncbi:S24 family peptidase [Candidatus Aalborgicola defluviihabitans]|uniref:S24 family peptidase n=1 Tax=Candidatus Aalborgicola defluviihabitans TaxID=3386187 RepID=UPI0039B973CE